MNGIILAAIFGVVFMLLGLQKNMSKKTISKLAIISSILLLAINIYSYLKGDIHVNGADTYYIFDKTRWAINIVVSIIFVLYILLFTTHINEISKQRAEIYALLFFIISGIFQLTAFQNMLSLFLAVEIISIPQYILAGSDKENIKSNEASLKYFLMGAFSTGILLMGITLMYGATGTFDIQSSNIVTLKDNFGNNIATLGIVFIVVSLAFKISLVPFHYWTPDVYDGTPTPLTPFMATVVKGAFVVAFYMLMHNAFDTGITFTWKVVLSVLSASTMILGNFTAVYQQSAKRMLAYSSIAQAGFMILPILIFTENSLGHIVLYYFVYSIATLGVFTILIHLKDYTFDGFLKIGKSNSLLAFLTTVFLFSLAGLPITGGFFAKFFSLTYIIKDPKMVWLAIIALITAAVSVYYYFKPIWSMYFKKGEAAEYDQPSTLTMIILVILGLMIILLGLFPDSINQIL